MPYRDGFDVEKKIRQKSDVVPILFLSARSMEPDKLQGFSLGGDDYITKPFSMSELLSRMQVFLRRNKMMLEKEQDEFCLGTIQFIPAELRLHKGGENISLTQKEAALLRFFCLHPNKILKREELLTHVWGKNDFFLGRSMDVYITRLRKYLRNEPAVFLETVHQAGYRFNLPANT